MAVATYREDYDRIVADACGAAVVI